MRQKTLKTWSGGKGKYINMLASVGLRLRQQCQFITLVFFVKVIF